MLSCFSFSSPIVEPAACRVVAVERLEADIGVAGPNLAAADLPAAAWAAEHTRPVDHPEAADARAVALGSAARALRPEAVVDSSAESSVVQASDPAPKA